MNTLEPSHGPCLDPASLRQLALGLLDYDKLSQKAAHIEACSNCQGVLAEFDSHEDDFVVQLKQQAAPEPIDSRLQKQIEAAEGISKVVWSDAAGKADPEPMPQKLGRYVLLEELGRGGMGVVYRAQHMLLNRFVALKVLGPRRAANPEAVSRFRREMQAVAALQHPHIVTATDADECEGRLFFVMELLDGKDLSRHVRDCGPMSLAEACDAVRQAALGLQHAHERGFVHRDLKPSNLLRTPEGVVKILDLGLSRLMDLPAQDGPLTDDSRLLGTADFMAPEQGLDPRDADARSDLYSLGCTLFYLLTGQPPFSAPERDTAQKKILAHNQEPLPSLLVKRPELPESLDQLVRELLAKQPAARPASAAELAERLAKYSTSASQVDLSSVENRAAESRSLRIRAVMLASVVLLCVLGIGFFLWLPRETQPPALSPESEYVETVPKKPDVSQEKKTVPAPAVLDIAPEIGLLPVPRVLMPPKIEELPDPKVKEVTRLGMFLNPKTGVMTIRAATPTSTVLNWQVVGPFAFEEIEHAQTAKNPAEKTPIALEQMYKIGEETRRWQIQGSENGTIALKANKVAGETGALTWYAGCWFRPGQAPHGWIMRTQGCGFDFWVNGKSVDRRWEPKDEMKRGWFKDQLGPGWNELLVKLIVVPQKPGAAEGLFRFTVSGTGIGVNGPAHSPHPPPAP